ncbi:pyruvate kinase [Anaerolineales bacterium]
MRSMIRAGMNVARINFSHGTHETHRANIEALRAVAEEESAVIAILCDIQGPKIRIGTIAKEPLELAPGDQITFTLDKTATGKDNIVALPHPEFMRDINSGVNLLLDDGNIELFVEETTGKDLICRVIIGGALKSRKGVSAPNARLTLSALTDKDREDIDFALKLDTDYIAMSFVRNADDIRELRWLMKHLGKDAGVIAKIEMAEALTNIESIIQNCDGIMVARGDLGVETPAEKVPYEQKRIIRLCNESSKPVITATQMLESMRSNPRPTRAEASDVYNAILDGTDAVMLSAESASGDFPIRAVEMMSTIAEMAEKSIWERRTGNNMNRFEFRNDTYSTELIADAISYSTFQISEAIEPKAIVTTTMSGYTTRRVAKERPKTPILCMTPSVSTYRRMALVWGVYPVLVSEFSTVDEMISVIIRRAYEENLVDRGDTLLIIAGVPFGIAGQTNLMKVHRVGEAGEI